MSDNAMNPIATAMRFFGRKDDQTLQEFAAEWRQLTATDKDQLTTGINNGTLTY